MPKKIEKVKVKDHSYKMPVGGLQTERRKVAVMLNPDTGIFTMDIPQEARGALSIDTVHGSSLGAVITDFDWKIDKYQAIVRAAGRQKVIIIQYAYNRAGPGVERHYGIGGSFSSDRAPEYAFGIEYEILWKINNGIYEIIFQDDDVTPAGDPQHRYSLPLDRRHRMIEWTQEREDFFANLVNGLQNMIDRANTFFGDDMTAYIDRAIASGGGFLSLPKA